MSVRNYAAYSLTFAFGAVAISLIDLGFTGSIVALVGDRTDDDGVISRFVSAALRLRMRMVVAALLPGAVVFWLLTAGHHWSATERAALFALLIPIIWAQSSGAASAAVLYIRRRLLPYYRVQLEAALTRTAMFGLLGALAALTAVVGTVLTLITTAWAAVGLRRRAKATLTRPIQETAPAEQREMLRYLRPIWPGLIFAAVQSQVAVLLIGAAGGTRALAQVAALTRLSQLFLLLTAFNVAVLEPFVARSPTSALRSRYLGLTAGAVLFALAVSAFAALRPTWILALLGSHYAGLEDDVLPIVAASALTYVASVLWTMNQARRWISHRYTWSFILVTLMTQLIAGLLLNITTTHGVVLFTLFTAIAGLAVHAAVGAMHLLTIPRGV